MLDPWWATLGERLDGLAGAFGVTAGDPAPEGHTSLVLRAAGPDGPVVLKVSPEPGIAAFEAAGLRALAGSGRVPAVLAVDDARGAILLEAIGDGVPLVRAERTPPAEEIAGLLGALRDAAPPPRPGLEPLAERVRSVLTSWVARRERDRRMRAAVPAHALPDSIERAVALAREAPRTVLLHGDLHPGNVLEGDPPRGLVAIDPRPCVGDPAYDAADWVVFRTAPEGWAARAAVLAPAVGTTPRRLLDWVAAFGALHAASAAGRDEDPARIAAFLALAG